MPVLVLLVEGDDLIRELLQEALEGGGFEVATAENGENALSMLDVAGAKYRALVTDIDFHGKLSGWTLAKHAREIDDRIAVIYITSANAHEWASRGVPKSLLLSKPFAEMQLLTAVSQLINEAGEAL